jgi:hypothetical protein
MIPIAECRGDRRRIHSGDQHTVGVESKRNTVESLEGVEKQSRRGKKDQGKRHLDHDKSSETPEEARPDERPLNASNGAMYAA